MATHSITVAVIDEIIRKQLGRKLPADVEITAATNFQQLGLSSLDFTEVYFIIEERLGFELDPAAAADVKTVGDLLEVLDKLVAAHVGDKSPTMVATS